MDKVLLLVWLAVLVFEIVALWKVFVKAGKPGWGIFIPIYSAYLFVKIAGRPGWWWVLFLVPVVNVVVLVIASIDVAKKFGKGVGFGIGLLLLGFIFYPILAFGSAQYASAQAAAPATPPPTPA